MKSVKLAWVLGAASAFALGVAAEACSSSSTTTGNNGNGDSGASGTGSSPGSGTSGTSGSGSSPQGSSPGSGSGSAECFTAPGALHPESAAGVYCPFSSVGDGGSDITCTAGQHCCSPPESAKTASACFAASTACGAKDVDWVCEGTPDCAGNSGTVCCGQGKILQQSAQPGCAKDGGTIEPFPYASGFYGTACQTSCTVFGDGGLGFQVCSKDSECPGAVTGSCVAIKPKGNGIGYCADAGAGTGPGSSTGSGSSTGAGSGSGSNPGSGTGSGSAG